MEGGIARRPAPVRKVEGHGHDFAHSRQFEWLARAGLVARGVVYGTVGILAIKLALGNGGKSTGQEGALATLSRQPFGKALMIAMVIGLAGYAIWRLVRAALGRGPEAGEDSGFQRAANAESGIAYGLLCIAAIKILSGSGAGGSDPDKTTGGVLAWPAGPWIVAAAGAVLVGVGLYQGHKGVTLGFCEDSKTEQMSARVRRAFSALGVFGHLARMVVFGMIGYFLIRAAIDYDAEQAIGLDGALTKLANAPHGPVLLGIVAAGLIGFAAYSLADARYRRV